MLHRLQKAAGLARILRGGRLLLFLALLVPAKASADLEVALQPFAAVVAPATEFEVAVVVTAAGPGFNGFDLAVGFDPSRLTLLAQEVSDQPGQLMLAACTQSPFHLFQVATDSTHLDATLVLMCAGASITETGPVYRLRFAAKHRTGRAALRFLPGTGFYNAGVLVGPLVMVDGAIDIGSIAAVADTPAPPKLILRAAPNPFNPRTVLSFDVTVPGPVKLTIYAINGRRLTTLVDQPLTAGEHQVVWDGTDSRGLLLPSSSYRVCLETRDTRTVQAVTLLK